MAEAFSWLRTVVTTLWLAARRASRTSGGVLAWVMDLMVNSGGSGGGLRAAMKPLPPVRRVR